MAETAKDYAPLEKARGEGVSLLEESRQSSQDLVPAGSVSFTKCEGTNRKDSKGVVEAVLDGDLDITLVASKQCILDDIEKFTGCELDLA